MKRALLITVFLVGLVWIFFGHKVKTSKEQKTYAVTEQKPFVIVTPSFNNAKWCEKNLSSVFEQTYSNYRLIYIDDCSTDGTADKVEEIVAKSGKQNHVQLIRNKSNKGAMENFYQAIHLCSDQEIVVCLDGDDWLAHDKVLERLNEIYANPNVWLAYGGYMEYPTYKKGDYSKPFPIKIIKKNQFRKHPWSASHIRTFYAGLFKKVRVQDFLRNNSFLKVSCDVAMMLPMLEMAGDKIGFIPRKDVLYIYNHANPLNDDVMRWKLQQEAEKYIRSLTKYKPLSSLDSLSEKVKEDTKNDSDFEELMGKKTHHWNHLSKQEDKLLLKLFKGVYETSKQLQLVQTSDVKIPKVVHFIWLGPKQFPPESVENIRTWMAKNPEWTFKFWTDRPRTAPCKGMETIVLEDYPFPYLKRCYETSENWGEKSDCLRFEILYNEGGLYVDHDANCLQSFDALHRAYDLYCGLEMPHLPMGGHAITLGNGVIGSCAAHPVIKTVVDKILSRWDELEKKYEGKDAYSRSQIVIERTYLALTLAMKEMLGKSGKNDIILPAAYFFAKQGVKPVYSKHFYANSWAGGHGGKDAFEKRVKGSLQKIEQKINNSLMLTLAILIFNAGLIGLSFYVRRRKA